MESKSEARQSIARTSKQGGDGGNDGSFKLSFVRGHVSGARNFRGTGRSADRRRSGKSQRRQGEGRRPDRHRRGTESRPRKSAQDDKWNFCLTTAIIAVNRRNHDQTTSPEPLTGFQGEGGSGRRQGRPNHSPAGRAFRRSPQPDNDMEIAA